MIAKIEVRAAVDAFKLLEAEREAELDIGSRIGIVGKFLVVMETVVLRTHSKVHMPLHTVFLPFCEPFEFGARFDEELHLHLFEFPHTEYELTGYNLVAESLSDLGYSERNLHAASLLHIQIVHEDALSCLRTEVQDACGIGCASHRGLEHQVELAYVSPVASAADRAYYAAVNDNLTVLCKVIVLLGSHISVVNFVVFGLFAKYVRIGGAELSLIESLSELLASLLDFLVHLILYL